MTFHPGDHGSEFSQPDELLRTQPLSGLAQTASYGPLVGKLKENDLKGEMMNETGLTL